MSRELPVEDPSTHNRRLSVKAKTRGRFSKKKKETFVSEKPARPSSALTCTETKKRGGVRGREKKIVWQGFACTAKQRARVVDAGEWRDVRRHAAGALHVSQRKRVPQLCNINRLIR